MQWIALALLALLVGLFQANITPMITAKFPASVSANKWALSFFNGAVILLAVIIAAFALSLVGLESRKL